MVQQPRSSGRQGIRRGKFGRGAGRSLVAVAEGCGAVGEFDSRQVLLRNHQYRRGLALCREQARSRNKIAFEIGNTLIERTTSSPKTRSS